MGGGQESGWNPPPSPKLKQAPTQIEHAGAELGQAQVKLKVMVEVVIKVEDEVVEEI